MKRIISLIFFTAIIALLVSSCNTVASSNEPKKLNIVCTTFAQYDWTKQILGTHINDVTLTFLLDNGVDLHSYQATADDIIKVSSTDMLIYVGGESDSWVKDVLRSAVNKNIVAVDLVQVLGSTVKEEELVEGMQSEKDAFVESELDEHIWLSLKNAQRCTAEIAKQLAAKDEKNAADYITNANIYIEKLVKIDNDYRQMVGATSRKTLIVADRFPFRYLVDDYDIDYFAAFAGCSAETEASFDTVAFLARKIDELELKSIISLEDSQNKIAQTIKQSTKEQNQKLLRLDSMQSVTATDIQNGTTYLSIMEKNLIVLKEALN